MSSVWVDPTYSRSVTPNTVVAGDLSRFAVGRTRLGSWLARVALGSFVAVFCGVAGYIAAVKLAGFLL